MEAQVISKQRVADHGEVLTGKREVNAMLDLVKQETEQLALFSDLGEDVFIPTPEKEYPPVHFLEIAFIESMVRPMPVDGEHAGGETSDE